MLGPNTYKHVEKKAAKFDCVEFIARNAYHQIAKRCVWRMRWEYQCRHCGCKGIDKMRDRETQREQMDFNSRWILEERQHLLSKICILSWMHLLLPATYLHRCLHLYTCICSRLVLSCKHHHHPQRTNIALGTPNCYWSSHIGKYWRKKIRFCI